MLASALICIVALQILSGDDVLALVLEGEIDRSGSEYLQIHFLDVGQGDAIFIETPDQVQVLVDGGTGREVLRRVAEHMSPLDRSIDMIVGTHPHDDHIGGLVDVLERFTVEHIMLTENEAETEAAEQFTASVHEAVAAGATVWQARAGHTFGLGASTTVTVLSPTYDPTDMNADASSIMLQVRYGDTAVVLPGDAPTAIEERVVAAYGSGLQSDVLKLGHHGSDTSSAAVFLDTVDPSYGVVSAGRDSQHGHPHESVMARVEERDIEAVSTQTNGTITFYSDGTEVWLVE